jgi:hypothetical protein
MIEDAIIIYVNVYKCVYKSALPPIAAIISFIMFVLYMIYLISLFIILFFKRKQLKYPTLLIRMFNIKNYHQSRPIIQ